MSTTQDSVSRHQFVKSPSGFAEKVRGKKIVMRTARSFSKWNDEAQSRSSVFRKILQAAALIDGMHNTDWQHSDTLGQQNIITNPLLFPIKTFLLAVVVRAVSLQMAEQLRIFTP